MLRRFALAAVLGAALIAAGCKNDELNTPAPPAYAGGAMFSRYVSLGSSITSGFQSGGINDSLQKQAYPVLVAAAMGGQPFYYPSLNPPGCPPPYTNIFLNQRLGGAGVTGTTCAYRASTPPYVSNLGVPSAKVLDIAQNGPNPPNVGTNSNGLTQIILGGRTQLQAMADARPTFVSVWIGNNDVLGAVLVPNSGDSSLITPVATFQTQYQQVVDGVKATGAKALLIGVANVTEIPYTSQGGTYFAIKAGLVPGVSFPPTFFVDPLCAPNAFGGIGDSVLVPFPFGAALLGAAQAGVTDTLHCTEPQTVSPAELRKILATVTAYNSIISGAATTNGWAYVDPNPTLDSLRLVPGQVAPFPNIGAACSTSPFGLAFSCDGYHPSASSHRVIAKHVVVAINAKYGSAIPAVP